MAAPAEPVHRRVPSLRARRAAFWIYSAVLFTATHWPKAELPGPANTDKVLHITAFGLWTVLFALAAYIRPVRRVRSLAALALIGAAWAGLDELLQEIPFIHRHATMEDYVANLIGVGLGVAAAVALAPLARGPAEAQGT